MRAGKLEEMFPGVYRYPGSPVSWEQRVCAALEWAGDGSAASGRCAAALWELDGIEPGAIEITSPRCLRPPDPSVSARRAQLLTNEIRKRRGITMTSPERTLLDLGTLVSARTLEGALDDALGRGLTTPERLHRFLTERGCQGRNGTAPLKTLLDRLDRSSGTNHFERLLSTALRKAGLPKPTPQHRVDVSGRSFYLDFAFPKARLGIEAQGYRYHSARRDDWEKDHVRHALLTTAGWTMVYVTWRRLTDNPEQVVQEIRAVLERSLRMNDNKLAF